MKYFDNYQQIVRFVIKNHITTISELLTIACIKIKILDNYDEEQQWIKNHVDGTFCLTLRTLLIRADLSAHRYKLAVLHECGHILLGHEGNFVLSSLPQSGSPEEHDANMLGYSLLMIFRYFETSDIRKDFKEIADTYELPYSEIDNLKEAHEFVNNILVID